MKKTILAIIAGIAVVIAICGICIIRPFATGEAIAENNHPTPDVVVIHNETFFECGCCGALTKDTYWTRNDANTKWVNICGRCADLIDGIEK